MHKHKHAHAQAQARTSTHNIPAMILKMNGFRQRIISLAAFSNTTRNTGAASSGISVKQSSKLLVEKILLLIYLDHMIKLN